MAPCSAQVVEEGGAGWGKFDGTKRFGEEAAPMGTIPSSLELHVHSVDGHVARFGQNDAAAVLTLLDHIQPGRIFSQRHLMIVGGGSLNVFPSAALARVDLVMNGFPDWPFHWGITDVREITETEFRQRYH